MNYDESVENIKKISSLANKYSTKNDFDFDPTHELINTIMQYESVIEWLEEIKYCSTDKNDISIIDMIINDLIK
jgi:hypothetical protein